MNTDAPVLAVHGLRKEFPVKGHREADTLVAVDGVDLEIRSGERFALVGESGCGKSTLARCISGLIRPTGGSVQWSGDDITATSSRQLRHLRPHTQFVFQDAASALSPRLTIGESLVEPAVIQGRDLPDVGETLASVGLDPALAARRPKELSGGQRQRVVIARALVLRPRLLVLDEPVASLDVSVQAQVLNLLADLQDEYQFASLMIAHDLGVVGSVADRVGVMYLGRVVEGGTTANVLDSPVHPYTRALVEAIPGRRLSGDEAAGRWAAQGEPPSPLERHPGCAFAGRCPARTDVCDVEMPPPSGTAEHRWRCHNVSPD